MPFGAKSFGLNGTYNNSTTKTNSAFTRSTTPVVPEWASTLTQGVAGRVGSLLDVAPESLIAPANSLQNQAGGAAGALSGSPWNFDAAADLTRGAANTSWLDGYMRMDAPFASGGKANDYVGNYLNPYLRDVVDSTSADLDAHEGQIRAQQALNLAGSGAFGGSGAALTQSMTEGELARARAASLAGLRSHAYDTALGAAAGDADRATQARIANAQTALQDRAQKVGFGFQGQQQQMQAGNQLADISSAYEANLRGNIGAQAGLGDTFREIDQEQRQAPVTTAQQIVAMLSGLPINLFVGENEQGANASTSKTKGFTVGAKAGF